MTGRGGAALYTPGILALAVELAEFPMTEDLALRGEAQSRVCGSRVAVGLAAEDGRIERIGARVSACAIGQAAAALLLRSAKGRDAAEIENAYAVLEAWLREERERPSWPGIELLEPARAYPARHAAILLPWKAALAALSIRETAD